LRLPLAARITMLLWFIAAAAAGASGILLRVPFPVPQIAILGLVAASLVAATTVPSVRAWIDALPLRTLVAANALRFIGIVFLVLAARGQLAPVFADRAGWGDITTAALALVLVATGAPRTAAHRAAYHVWNVLGALDLIVAVGTATWVVLHDLQPGVQFVVAFPLSLVPLFFVPLFLVGHVFIFRHLVAAGRSGAR
ncbi:MAG TPA: hypothetical protein VIW26_01135, partial [Gemmatimonadales bacterium]